MSLIERKHLYHTSPSWVADGACFFVTICALPRGVNQLASNTNAGPLLTSAARYHQQGIWWAHLFLLMPDHLHAMVAVPPDRSLEKTVRSWKSWQTKTLRIEWQEGFFDHRLRSDESFEEKCNYIRLNPVRAGLVERPEDWPHVWEPPH